MPSKLSAPKFTAAWALARCCPVCGGATLECVKGTVVRGGIVWHAACWLSAKAGR